MLLFVVQQNRVDSIKQNVSTTISITITNRTIIPNAYRNKIYKHRVIMSVIKQNPKTTCYQVGDHRLVVAVVMVVACLVLRRCYDNQKSKEKS